MTWNNQTPEQSMPAPEPGKPSQAKRNTLIGIGVGALVAICCCAVVVLALVIDPFGWDLLGRLRGDADIAAKAMPVDTGAYVGINLLNLTPDKIERVTSPFQDAFDEISGGEFDDMDEFTREFEDMLDDELDINFEEDIMPWIGQYAGLGLSDIEINMDYGEIEDANILFSIEVRDRDAADAFIAKITENFSDSSGYDFDSWEYQGVEIFEVDTDYDWDRWAIARSGRLLLVSQDGDGIEDGIDAQNAESLADMDGFEDIARRLPGERALTFYLDETLFEELYQSVDDLGLGIDLDDLNIGFSEMAASLSITDAGLQFDALVHYDLDSLSAAQLEMMENTTANGEIAEVMPANTIAFLAGARLDLVWDFYQAIIEDSFGAEDYNEMIAEFEDMFGFDPTTDLLPYLNGEYALGLTESSAGMLADQSYVDFGLLLVAEISERDPVENVVDDFIAYIEDEGASVEEMGSGGLAIYEAGDEFFDEPILAVAINDETLGIGTSGELLEEALMGGDSLSDSRVFQDVWQAFPGGTSPVLYIDLQLLLDVLNNSDDDYLQEDIEEASAVLEPIEQIAMGSSGLDGEIVQTTLIIFLAEP